MLGIFRRIFTFHSIFNNLGTIQQSDNNVILFGSVGHGKTTILNNVCGESYDTAESGFSCTRDVQCAYSLKGDMIIIDFPGLRSTKDTIKHLKKQKNALKVIPVKMICFVIKYDKRYDHLIDNLTQMLRIFYSYKDNITIIVTHSEDCSYTDKENIKEIFSGRFGITNTIFTTKNTPSPLALCETFGRLKSNMNNIPKLELLKTRDFLASIKDVFDFSVMEEREKYENEFNETLKKFEEQFKKADNDDLKRAIYFAFKDYKEDLIERYSKAVQEKKADTESIIIEVIMFNNFIFNKFNDFRMKAQSQIKIHTNNYNINEYNRYKKCPHCGQIWFKIKGCDSMVCGKRTTLKDKICGTSKNYIVEYVRGKIMIRYNEKINANYGNENDSEFVGLTETERQQNIVLEKIGKTKISPVGCGKSFKWNDSLVNDCTDEIIRKLNEISISDYDSGVIKIADSLGEKEL